MTLLGMGAIGLGIFIKATVKSNIEEATVTIRQKNGGAHLADMPGQLQAVLKDVEKIKTDVIIMRFNQRIIGHAAGLKDSDIVFDLDEVRPYLKEENRGG